MQTVSISQRCQHATIVVAGQFLCATDEESLTLFARAVAEFNMTRQAIPHPGFVNVLNYCPNCGAKLDATGVQIRLNQILEQHEALAAASPLDYQGSVQAWITKNIPPESS